MEGPLTPPAALTVLYTHRLRGGLDRLPRLFTFLRELRARAEGAPVLLVDLGESCSPEVWHCAVTSGRSALFALDGMGYHAANVSGVLDAELRLKMVNLTQMALVDADHPFAFSEAVQVAVAAAPNSNALCTISLHPAPETAWDGRLLRLAALEDGQVGRARLRDGALEGADVFGLPPSAAPDPTIAGMVDFILGEARYTQKRQSGG
ncbi:MAG: hypothetical protein JNL34_09695 [Anaerolineae bacterium]|nr:hypothetical protein [Anaerolineae bacterium]